MISDNDGLLLEMYLDGALAGEELMSFEKRLQEETALAQALEERSALHQFLKDQPQREQVENILPEVAKAHFKPSAKIRPLWQRSSFRIASIAAAIALIVFIWQPWQQASLYEQFGQHKNLALAERGTPNLDPSNIEKAFAAKEYQKSIPLLENYLQAYPNSIEANLYLGICHLESNHYQRSTAIFKSIAEGESSFKYAGLWYLALTAVKQKQAEQAAAYLTLIPEDSAYFGQANALLEKLK